MLNHRALDGFFQDDEFDTLGWAPFVPARQYVIGFLKPLFDASNFRPAGHLYFTLMSNAVGMNFPSYIPPIFFFHLVNCALVFCILRKLGTETWRSIAATAFFGLSASAMDAYWKPMYVYDLFCATFCLASILLFIYRRWILSFLAFWLAYKAKELAVMLPLALLAYEHWLGERRFKILIPFFLASLSFGIQGLLMNPNKNNDYTFRFTLNALKVTVPFYARKLLLFRWSTLLLLPLLLLRDRRIWFALFAMGCFLFTLLFLPGRLFEAYFYLPLACAAIAMGVASTRTHPACAWIFIAIWSIFNVNHLQHKQNDKLRQDDQVFAFVGPIEQWAAVHPAVTTLVYPTPPPGFHDWGVAGAWSTAHHAVGLQSFFKDSPEGVAALASQTVALSSWDEQSRTYVVRIHSPK